ncbi:MAG: preprotein translocase subunit SecE [Candidatus Omnitrophota bacterium]|nr:preprotein translocase subunit SecE [Candidatus Omnitrophota bacterium]
MFELIIKNFTKIILAVAGFVSIFFIVKNFEQIKKFLIEVRLELTKVSWSTRKELITSTWVVIATTGFLAVFIGTVDFVLSKFLSLLIKR